MAILVSSVSLSVFFVFVGEDVSSQLLLQYHVYLHSAIFPAMIVMDSYLLKLKVVPQ